MPEQALEAAEPAPVFPVDRVYPLTDVESVERVDSPESEDWAAAIAGEGFFAEGEIEVDGSRSRFYMVRGEERLHVRVRCASRGDEDSPELIQFYVTQDGEPDFPCIAVIGDETGEFTVGEIWRAHTWWDEPRVYALDDATVPREVRTDSDGWELTFSLPFDDLEIPREGFRFNVVHELADGTRYAWSDLAVGPSNQFSVYGHAFPVHEVGGAENGLVLPSEVSVGANQLALEEPDADLRLRVDDQVLEPNEEGVFDLIVPRRGPVRMELTDDDGRVLGTYHADVRRPLLIHAPQRYVSADAETFELDVAIDVAGESEIELDVVCQRDGGEQEEHDVSVPPGEQTIELPVPAGDGEEVRVSASAVLTDTPANEPVTLDAMHWFAVGVTEDELDTYRNGIEELPIDRMYWAVLADAIPTLLQNQHGSGHYGLERNSGHGVLWPQMCVYAVALLYKTEHPDNPYFDDERLLDSAIKGMEDVLRPEIRMFRYSVPDSRSPQALLMTYDLLEDDIGTEIRDHWARELEHRAEAEAEQYIRRMVDKYTFYSADSETSTNHMAYHVSNSYLAGQLFDRDEWVETGRKLMHRLARHGEPGYFEEQKGSPVNHYTWLTASALGEYYEHSGDESVLPTLEAASRYMTAITTAEGETMALHDSRNGRHHPFRFGDFVLSRTPEGRSAARARLLGTMGDGPSDVGNETLSRLAESAVFFEPGEEADVFGQDRELAFPHGIIVRKRGFQYGLSTIARLPTSGHYKVDSQNLLELFHEDAGAILHGGNSQRQPEAGTFMRELGVPGTENATPDATHDYLPQDGSVAATADGHDLRTRYRTFDTGVAVHVLSSTEAQVDVAVHNAPSPVVFNFFPAANEDEEVEVDPDGRSIRVGRVKLTANVPFRTETRFRIFHPYDNEHVSEYKPIRCWVELDGDDRVTLDVEVLPE